MAKSNNSNNKGNNTSSKSKKKSTSQKNANQKPKINANNDMIQQLKQILLEKLINKIK
ncbi:MAG: hypothetical protein RRZ84_03860 [Romboutsia sp.]